MNQKKQTYGINQKNDSKKQAKGANKTRNNKRKKPKEQTK